MIELRVATLDDLELVTAIEAACFNESERASRARFIERLKAFSDDFLLLFVDGQAVGMIDGMVTNRDRIVDEMYADATLHDPKGAYQSVFSLAVKPEFQHRGYAKLLMRAFIEKAQQEGRQGVILTCKAEKRGFYEQFGYTSLGVSASVHGGAQWFDMIVHLPTN